MQQVTESPFDIGPVIRHAWEIYRMRMKDIILYLLWSMLIATCALLVPLALFAVSAALPSGPAALARGFAGVLGLGVVIAATAVFVPGYFHLVSAYREKIGYREAMRRGLKQFWPFVVTQFLAGLVILGGYVMLIVPGIIWAVSFMMLPWIIVREGGKGMPALLRARRLVKGDGLMVFLYTIALSILSSIVSNVLTGSAKEGTAAWGVLTSVWLILYVVLVGPFTMAFSLSIYEALVAKKPNPPELPANQKSWFTAAIIIGPILLFLVVIAIFANLFRLAFAP